LASDALTGSAESEASAGRVAELEGLLATKEKELADSKKKFLTIAKKKQVRVTQG
jgi:hypothetical protein